MQEQIKAVQRMQDYIAVHLFENITLTDLSKVSLFSPWYAHRLFVQFLHLTPSSYIRKLRLSQSALKLRDNKTKIVDVAYEFGFGSVDGYQRAFLNEFGCNPHQYARNPIPICLFKPYGIQYAQMKGEVNMQEVKNIFIQVVEKPARKVIIKRGKTAEDYWTYCQEVGCDVWGLLTSIKSINGEPVCLWLPENYILEGTSKYVQGVEVPLDYNGVVPYGFDVIQLPKSQYMMFQGEPFEEKDFCMAIQQIQGAIQKYNPTFWGYVWDNNNPRIQLEPIGTRGYIELMPIKSKEN